MERIGGTCFLTVNGQKLNAKGEFSYSFGFEKREAKVGSDGKIHGYVGTPQVPFIEGKITDSSSLSAADIGDITSGTIILELANGKTIVCTYCPNYVVCS